MLVFEYRKAPFSAETEQALDAGIKKIAAENTVITTYVPLNEVQNTHTPPFPLSPRKTGRALRV